MEWKRAILAKSGLVFVITMVSPLVSNISCWVSVSYQYRSFRPKKYQYSISIEVQGPGKYQYSISIEFSDLGSISIVSVSKKTVSKGSGPSVGSQ